MKKQPPQISTSPLVIDFEHPPSIHGKSTQWITDEFLVHDVAEFVIKMKKTRKKMKKDPIQNYVKAENYGIDQQMAQMDFSAAFKVITN